MTIPPGCCDTWRGRPWASRASATWRPRWERGRHVALDVLAAPGVGRARHPLYLPRGEPERPAEIAHRRAHAVGGEGGHQRGPVAAIALMHARNQDLADIAREVEIDVRQRPQVVVEEAAQEEVALHRIHVRKAGEITDDRRHARAAPPPRRQQRPSAVRTTHLACHLARQFEQVAVEQEEACQTQGGHDPQLLAETRGGPLLQRMSARVALVEALVADLGEPCVGGRVLRPGVGVTKVAGDVEAQALGQPAGLVNRLGGHARVVEALRHRRGGREHVRSVAAPPGLGFVKRPPQPGGHEGVLEPQPRAGMSMDVPRRHAGHPQAIGQFHEQPVAAAIVA